MFCDRCGAQLQGPVTFCPYCRRQFAAAPPPPVVNRVQGHLRTVAGVFVGAGLIGVIAGWGLYERRSWARILAIVLGFISLVHPPFGTAIGIYTLWVLLPASSEVEYQRMARAEWSRTGL